VPAAIQGTNLYPAPCQLDETKTHSVKIDGKHRLRRPEVARKSLK
jgi:hypothetical protein